MDAGLRARHPVRGVVRGRAGGDVDVRCEVLDSWPPPAPRRAASPSTSRGRSNRREVSRAGRRRRVTAPVPRRPATRALPQFPVRRRELFGEVHILDALAEVRLDRVTSVAMPLGNSESLAVIADGVGVEPTLAARFATMPPACSMPQPCPMNACTASRIAPRDAWAGSDRPPGLPRAEAGARPPARSG